MIQTPLLIVGAGPYGLALANYLSELGTPFTIIGKTMELWRKHTFSSADLRSDADSSTIPHPENKYTFQNYFASIGEFGKSSKGRVAVKEYRRYLDWMEEQLPYEVKQNYLSSLTKEGQIYRARLDDGTDITAAKVIIATGVAHHLFIPEHLKEDTRVIHSYDAEKIEALRDKKLLIIGAGQSAAEAIEICERNGNQIDWYSRKKPKYYSEPLNLPKWMFDLVVRSAGLFKKLPSFLVKYLFAIFSASTMTPEYSKKLRHIKHVQQLPDLEPYDHIISATGYQYGMREMTFLSDPLKESLKIKGNMPAVDENFMSSQQGLYFTGPCTEQFFGPPVKFMIGSHYVAPKLSQHLSI